MQAAKGLSSRDLLPLVCPLLLLLPGVEECTVSDADEDGWTVDDGDCNDSDDATHPGAAEQCNGRDDDCDRLEDEDFSERYFRDADQDGFGDELNVRCTASAGYIQVRGDCNDTDATIHAGTLDTLGDGIDQDCGGADGSQPSVGLEASALTSLQAAIDAALPGELVWVGPGIRQAINLNPLGKDLRLISTHLAHATMLDAEGRGRVLELTSGETVETLIEGFTLIRGSVADLAGGALLVEGGSPILSRCVVRDSSAVATDPRRYPDGGSGGGVALVDARARLSQVEIRDNASHQARVEDCTNHCDYLISGGFGGGLYAQGGSNHFSYLFVHHNRVIPVSDAAGENDVYTIGGGLMVREGTATIEHSRIEANQAYRGAGVWASDMAISITDSVLLDNEGDAVAQGGIAALYMVTSDISLQRLTVAFNRRYTPGGIYVQDSDLILEDSHIYGNHRGLGGGGGISIARGRTRPVQLRNVLIQENHAEHGAGLALLGSEAIISQSTLVQNYGRYGGGIYLDSCLMTLENSLITHNTGYNIYNLPQFPGEAIINASSIFSPNGPNENLSTSGAPVTWMAMDPRYVRVSNDVNPTNDDYHLKPDSPLRDAGREGSLDCDGSPAELGMFGGTGGDQNYYLDVDRDDLYDGWELIHWQDLGTATAESDLDTDELTEQHELIASTDPREQDSDRDGISDGVEMEAASDPTDWYHRPDGLPGADSAGFHTAHVPQDFPTLSEAVNAIRSRGSVRVSPGQYRDQLLVAGKSLKLIGTEGSAATKVSPLERGSLLTAQWSDVLVQGLSLEGAESTAGAGLDLTATTATLRDMRILNGRARSGGGIYADRSTLTVEDSLIQSNTASGNGGGLYTISGTIQLRAVDLVENSASRGGGWAVAINGSYLLQDVQLIRNQAVRGGGMRTSTTSEDIPPLTTFYNVAFTENSASEAGGCLYGNGNIIGSGLRFVGCSAGEHGGAFYSDFGNVTFSHVTAVLNRSVLGTGGLVMPTEFLNVLNISNSIFSYNQGYNLYLMPNGDGEAPILKVTSTSLYNPGDAPSHNIPGTASPLWNSEPGFLSYGMDGQPDSTHLSAVSPLIDVGYSSPVGGDGTQDVDGSPADAGMFGGTRGAAWDRDHDGLPDWFWPGTHSNAPTGFAATDFDEDDDDPATH